MYKILQREAFTETTFLWEVEAPDVAAAAQPGHFAMLRLHEGAERIPLTIADFDRERGSVTLVIQALGKTTREMRDHYKAGDTFEDFVGPLGLPQHIARVGHVLLVGGGLGVAPIFPQLRAFHEAGSRTTSILGFRSKDMVFWEDRFAAHSKKVICCTDDGSYGRKGLVTEALAERCAADRPDLVIAIGPLAMMRACAELTRPLGIRTLVSLNTIMVDGTGMCGSCRVTVGGNVRFACVDGPDFDGHAVDFAELVGRQRRFGKEEDVATLDQEHVCKLERTLILEGKRNYKKIRELAPLQTPMPERDPTLRSRDFQEVNVGYSLQDALAEAERCIQCANPTCISGCPVWIDIPRFIRHVAVRDFGGALGVIHESNLFPSICGRVCPQESQCEAHCVIAKKVDAVAIGRLERYVGDHARAPRRPGNALPPSGKVAVVGSGPAGLAAAADLVRSGIAVTVYEALHVVGGVLRYGIPAFRLPREIIEREVDYLRDLGVRFEVNKVIGKTFTVAQLLGEKGFDAVFLGVGAGAPAFLGIPGEQAGQVYSANEFLTRVNLMGGNAFVQQDTPVGIGSSVVVIGAGNTAMDCLRVARRLGVETVRCVYRRSESEAPARKEEIRHAKEEGVEFHFLHAPSAILTDANGAVRGLQTEEMELGEPDERGRRKPMPTGRRTDLPCDTVIYALGTKANPILAQSTPGLEVNERGNILADATTQATTLPGVFAGGDIVTGGATVILAMGAGRRAAKAIATYLRAGKVWPVTEADIAVLDPLAPHEAGQRCPKCQQPIEEGEAYVCCADASLQWHCTDCAKVSEGFAFPYGMCPACGGRLEAMTPTTPDRVAAFDAIRVAFEIELGGQAFYLGAALETNDPVMKPLFQKFARMEEEHMATLARRYHVQVPRPSGAHSIARAAIYAHVPHHPADPVNLFEIAIGFEQRAVRFFRGRSAMVPAGSSEQALYRALAAEEEEHVAVLTTELERWIARKPGLL